MIIKTNDIWNDAESEHFLFFDKKVTLEIKKDKSTNMQGGKEAAFNFLHQNIDTIKKGKLSEFESLIILYENTLRGMSEKFISDFKFYIENKINYSNFSTKKIKEWDAYTLCKKSRIKTCPYCNLSYAHTIYRDADKKLRPTLDHFFCKKDYPFLALSLYNLVPSCYICNSSLKGDENFFHKKHLYPFSDQELKLTIENINYFKFRNHTVAKIKVQCNTAEANNSASTFEIKDRYEYIEDEISPIIRALVNYKNAKPRFISATAYQMTIDMLCHHVDEKNYRNKIMGKLILSVRKHFS